MTVLSYIITFFMGAWIGIMFGYALGKIRGIKEMLLMITKYGDKEKKDD